MILKTKNAIAYSLVVVFMTMSLFVFAQNDKKASLQKEYNALLEEIADIENLLKEATSQREQSLAQLQALEAKINSRQELMDNINNQVIVVNQNISTQQAEIQKMENDIAVLKEEYAEMIYNSYKGMYLKNQISFIFSAENFNQAMNRFNYLRSYAAYRESQAELIQQTIVDLQEKIIALEAEKVELDELLKEEEAQKEILLAEKAEKDILLTQLKEDEDNLKQQVQEKNQAALALNNEIQNIIEEEIRLAKEKAEAENPSTTTTNNTSSENAFALTPEEQALSTSFINNMGKLPWPVVTGHIIERFGEHPHPTLIGVKINNNGLNIQTEEDAAVRVIFEGKVINAFYLPATQNTVLVKHGEYYTVYSNLKTVNVKAGDLVSTKQNIGTTYTSEKDGVSIVHLEIWKGTTKSNPEPWLSQ
ncbi:MAG: murein hydrolase activator EnvC family protein [Chitinophagales bacterium]